MTTAPRHGYDTKPWLALLDDVQKAPVAPPPTVVHAFRAGAARHPERTALAYFDGRIDFREADLLSDSVAGHLAAHGLGPGDRVAVMLQNSPHYVLAVLGVWKAGGVVVPVNPMYKSAEVAHVLADAEASGLVCADRTWEAYLREAAAGTAVRLVLTADERQLQSRDDERVLSFQPVPAPADTEDLLTVARAGHRAPEGRERTAEDIALISYTSGTSGTPKGATNTHGNITYNAERQRTGSRIPEGSTYFALAPLFHITGMVAQFAACVLNGGTLALAYRFEPGTVLDALAEHRPAYTVGPATAFMALAAHPAATPGHFSSFVLISSGGAPLPPALVEKFRAGFGPYLHNGYGLTECTAPCASVPTGREAPVDPVSGTLAVGVPGPDSVVRILDPEGHEVPFGEQGEIAVRGPQVVPGYWRRPEATAETFPGGELRTGDIGFMDREGWLYVVDRKKDMINASGFKVWPREVEDVLYTHPAVREAAVVGVPDPYRGETVRAYVSLRAEADPADLVAHCKERLAAYKYPREVRVLPELPKTSSGKILRRELRSPSGAGSGGNETEGRV
ncbi:long-chain acyl-CoA synthetase [Streptomyces sp. CZ24]|uniref:class I adenylate-forming enzyme family protein n=1 Tax=unclassified Streptomyces TaxID=2593676 RepID=UPI000645EE6B|nr:MULTISPECIES: AMP-binding protein [unclassified Streptomyces]MBL0779350.1 AMP-binding protein [Streptomyces albidoflavus]MBL0802084.1 AMP-binding protein [Streptomyces albidoflavus]MCK2144360.1 AMP-binding protein [Streptomyces sp. WAC00276]MDH6192236.1 long-chain acyl-CoA synthetase [Streptomyces sp. CZ24]